MSDHTTKSGQYCYFCKLMGCLNQVLAAVLKVFFRVGFQNRSTYKCAVTLSLWKSMELKHSLQVKHFAKYPSLYSLVLGKN